MNRALEPFTFDDAGWGRIVMTAPEFTAAVAGLCGPGEAALIMICAEDGLSYCISSEEGAHESARDVAAGEMPVAEDVLLGVAVISGDGTLTEYEVRQGR